MLCGLGFVYVCLLVVWVAGCVVIVGGWAWLVFDDLGVLLLRYCFVWFGLVLVGLEFVVCGLLGSLLGCVNSVGFIF